MKVYCCSIIRNSELFFNGGVYAVKRTLADALVSIRHEILVDYTAGNITTDPYPQLVKRIGSGIPFWIAVAHTKPDELGCVATYRYIIDELPLSPRSKP